MRVKDSLTADREPFTGVYCLNSSSGNVDYGSLSSLNIAQRNIIDSQPCLYGVCSACATSCHAVAASIVHGSRNAGMRDAL